MSIIDRKLPPNTFIYFKRGTKITEEQLIAVLYKSYCINHIDNNFISTVINHIKTDNVFIERGYDHYHWGTTSDTLEEYKRKTNKEHYNFNCLGQL